MHFYAKSLLVKFYLQAINPQGDYMRHYEVLFIVKPTLTEDEIKTKVDFVKEIITKSIIQEIWSKS